MYCSSSCVAQRASAALAISSRRSRRFRHARWCLSCHPSACPHPGPIGVLTHCRPLLQRRCCPWQFAPRSGLGRVVDQRFETRCPPSPSADCRAQRSSVALARKKYHVRQRLLCSGHFVVQPQSKRSLPCKGMAEFSWSSPLPGSSGGCVSEHGNPGVAKAAYDSGSARATPASFSAWLHRARASLRRELFLPVREQTAGGAWQDQTDSTLPGSLRKTRLGSTPCSRLSESR